MCLRPVHLSGDMVVPCGKCEECIKDKQNEYAIRSMEEAIKQGSCWFFTLTYSNDNVPVCFTESGEIDEETGELGYTTTLTLNTKDVSDWKKRVRENINYKRKKEGKPRLKFSYMIGGEYGPQTHRPHYHGLMMGIDKADFIEFMEDWKSHFGYVNYSYIPVISNDGKNSTMAVASYVSKYVTKQRELEDELVLNGVVEKPRKQVSENYGIPSAKRFAQMKRHYLCQDIFGEYDIDNFSKLSHIDRKRLIDKIIKRRKYEIDGKSYKFPNYYKRKIFYVKDDLTQKTRSSALCHLVSHAMVADVRRRFMEDAEEYRARYDMGESLDALYKAAKMVCRIQESDRADRAEGILQVSREFMRKSKF